MLGATTAPDPTEIQARPVTHDATNRAPSRPDIAASTYSRRGPPPPPRAIPRAPPPVACASLVRPRPAHPGVHRFGSGRAQGDCHCFARRSGTVTTRSRGEWAGGHGCAPVPRPSVCPSRDRASFARHPPCPVPERTSLLVRSGARAPATHRCGRDGASALEDHDISATRIPADDPFAPSVHTRTGAGLGKEFTQTPRHRPR